MACSYCYARRMYKRFGWNPEVRWEPEHLLDLNLIPGGSKVFIGSTIELFGDWVKEKWLQDLFYWWIPRYPQLTFIFLTKQPQRLATWSPFPKNCWVGTSVTDQEMFSENLYELSKVKASIKFLSFEPLLQGVNGTPLSNLRLAGINWLIIGQQTPVSEKTRPEVEWITEIVDAANNAEIPIFIKDNMETILHHWEQDSVYANLFRNGDESLRQEFPSVQQREVDRVKRNETVL